MHRAQYVKTGAPIALTSAHIRMELLNPKARAEVTRLFAARNLIIAKGYPSEADKMDYARLNSEIVKYVHPEHRSLLAQGIDPWRKH